MGISGDNLSENTVLKPVSSFEQVLSNARKAGFFLMMRLVLSRSDVRARKKFALEPSEEHSTLMAVPLSTLVYKKFGFRIINY